jgi:lipopolysaccharide transport system ATP-binding protein
MRGRPEPIRMAQGFRSADGGILNMLFRDGTRHLALGYGEQLELLLDLQLNPGLTDIACIVDIVDGRGLPLSGRRIRLPERAPGQDRLQLQVAFRAELALGVYRIRARLVQAPDLHQHHRRVLCRYDADLSFEVVDNSIERFSGLFPLPVEISYHSVHAADGA